MRPVLGICVGMQVLFEAGEEHGVVTKGLGLVPGVVTRLTAHRVPHMGWNTVAVPDGSALFAGRAGGYPLLLRPLVRGHASGAGQGLVTLTEHGDPFVAAVELGSLWATQFHPEKSGDAGAALLRNWVARRL